MGLNPVSFSSKSPESTERVIEHDQINHSGSKIDSPFRNVSVEKGSSKLTPDSLTNVRNRSLCRSPNEKRKREDFESPNTNVSQKSPFPISPFAHLFHSGLRFANGEGSSFWGATPGSSEQSTPRSSKQSTPESSEQSTPESSEQSTPESSREESNKTKRRKLDFGGEEDCVDWRANWTVDSSVDWNEEEVDFSSDGKEEESDSDFEERPLTSSIEKKTPLRTSGTPDANSFKTPEKVKELREVFRKENFYDGQLFGTPVTLVREVAQDIRNGKFKDTPNSKMSSRVARKVFDDIRNFVIQKKDSVSFHETAFNVIYEEQPYMRSLANALVQADRSAQHKFEELAPPKEIINIRHLIQVDKGGFHICPPGHPMTSHLMDIKTSATGVYQAKFLEDLSGPSGNMKEKCSTFFPLNSHEEMIELLETTLQQSPLAMIGNRYLYSPSSEAPYPIEMYKEGVVIKSAFPVFYFNHCFGGLVDHQIVVGQPPLSDKKLLAKAQEAVSQYSKPSLKGDRTNPIRYRFEMWGVIYLIIDLAPSLPELGIKQGIFLQIPKDNFTDQVDSELLDALCEES